VYYIRSQNIIELRMYGIFMDNVNNAKNTGKFQDFLNSSAIICRSSAATSEAVINELVELASTNTPGLNCQDVKESVFAREAMFPTVIAPGLAMPHARVDGLENLVVALATVEKSVRFGSEDDGEDVKVVVLVLSPADNPGLHLHVVSALAREFSDLSKIEQVAELQSVAEVVEFFGVVQVRLPDYLKVGDLASGIGPVLQADDSLEFAFRKFGESRAEQIPVLDNEGSLLGVVMLKNILSYNLPLELLEGDDLSALYDLKPYAEVIRRAADIKVADVMTSDFETVCEDLPAAKLIKIFLQTPRRELLVVDAEKRLRGEVRLRDFCGKIFWE